MLDALGLLLSGYMRPVLSPTGPQPSFLELLVEDGVLTHGNIDPSSMKVVNAVAVRLCLIGKTEI